MIQTICRHNPWKLSGMLMALLLVAACKGPVLKQAGNGDAPKQVGSGDGNSPLEAATDGGYALGGVVWGLLPDTTVRLSNGNDLVSVGNSPFVFSNRLLSGSAYAVAVAVQPTGQVCVVNNGAGTMPDSRVTQVIVQCAPGGMSVGGNLHGLAALSAVTLANQGTSWMLSANGNFTVPTGFVAGDAYDVQVWADPQNQHCTVINGKGNVADANVVDLEVDCVAATAPAVKFTTGQDAVVEIGQVSMNVASTTQLRSGATVSTGGSTKPCGWPGGPLFIPDYGSFRLLIFSSIPASNFASAVAVLGADNLVDEGRPISAVATACAPNMFAVTNAQSYNSTFSYTGFPLPDPSTVVTTENIAFNCDQQGNSTPTDVAIYGGKMLIADPGHNRIRTWNTVPNNPQVRQPPDLAFGQSSFTTCDPQTTASGFNSPSGFYLGAQHFMVADRGNHRVLIWNRPFNSITNGDAADIVLGQADFVTGAEQPLSASSFDPSSVDSDETQVVVTDNSHNRVLVWSTFPTQNNQPADVVLGQPDFTSSLCNRSGDLPAKPMADTLCSPNAAKLIGPFLVVQDPGNLRVMIYRGH